MPASGGIENAIAQKKAALDALRPLPPLAIAQLRKHYDLELTYTSNAIEGNTLTMRETAEVIEHGITVGGKRLRDHLEALDHYEAVQWVHALADRATPPDEAVVCELHRRIVARSQPEIAGIYAMLPRRILGSAAIFPNPAKTPSRCKRSAHGSPLRRLTSIAQSKPTFGWFQSTHSATAMAARRGC